MGYCTIDQARAAGATGTDAEVTADIDDATRAIERYTRDVFAPSDDTVVAEVMPNGIALLYRTVRTVTEVRPAYPDADPIPATAYTVTSSTTPGEVDAIVFGGQGLSDPLIAGAEPWNGGYLGLIANVVRSRKIEVDGSFGWDATPETVTAACAILAAFVSSQDDAGAGAGLDVDDEGNAVSVNLSRHPMDETDETATTGHARVDGMLRPYRRNVTRLGAV